MTANLDSIELEQPRSLSLSTDLDASSLVLDEKTIRLPLYNPQTGKIVLYQCDASEQAISKEYLLKHGFKTLPIVERLLEADESLQRIKAATAAYAECIKNGKISQNPVDRDLYTIDKSRINRTAAQFHEAYRIFNRLTQNDARRKKEVSSPTISFAEETMYNCLIFIENFKAAHPDFFNQSTRPEDLLDKVLNVRDEYKTYLDVQSWFDLSQNSPQIKEGCPIFIEQNEVDISKIPFSLLPKRYQTQNESSAGDNLTILQVFFENGQFPSNLIENGRVLVETITTQCSFLMAKLNVDSDTRMSMEPLRNWLRQLNTALYESWSSDTYPNPLFKLETYERFFQISKLGVIDNEQLNEWDKKKILLEYINHLINLKDPSSNRPRNYYLDIIASEKKQEKSKSLFKKPSQPQEINQSFEQHITDLISLQNLITSSGSLDSLKDNMHLRRLDLTIKEEAIYELDKDEYMMAYFLHYFILHESEILEKNE